MIDPLGIKKNDPLGIKKDESLGLKKKVASKPRSQEELWGSDSQPQDLYTSLVTGTQEPQQESDGLGGPPSPSVKKKPSVLFPETPMGRPAASVMYEAKQPTLVESTPFEAKPKKYYRIVSDEKKAVEQQISDLEQRNARLGRTPESLTTEGTYQALQKQKAQLDKEFEPAQTAIKQIQRQAGGLLDPSLERLVYGATDGKYSYFTTDIINLNKDVEDKIIDRFDDAPEETKVKWYKGGLPVEAKEAIINSAKNEVLNDKYNVLKNDADNYIKNIKDNPSIPLEEKLKFQKEFKERSEGFNAQLALDYSGKLLKNNFKITDTNRNIDEAIPNSKYEGFIPDQLDNLSTFAEGMAQVVAKVRTAIPSFVLMGAEKFNQLTGISRPEDYTPIEATMDLINDTTNLNFLPSSQTKRGNIVVDGEWNPSSYSIGKTLAKTLPFTLKIMNDVKKGRIEGTPQSMISQLINPKYNKDLADKLRVVETAYKGTLADNYRDAKEIGMDDSKAFLYANVLSLAEGVSENIMPDFKYFDSLTGASLKAAFKGGLKQAVTKQAAKNVTKDFFKNFVLETGEEEVVLATEDALKYSLLLNHKNSEFSNMGRQKELVATTALLSGALGTVSTNQKFKQNKKDLYNSIHNNIYELQNSFLDEIDSPLNDQKAKEALITAYKFANDVSVAISNAPENVTADQIDLLVQKKNLEEKKKNIDTAFHPDINEEIAGIDAKIRELAKMPAAVEEVAVEEVAPAVEEVKPAEVAVKPSGQKVTDIINRPATLESQAGVKLETPIEGDVYQEGQRVIFEDKNKKTYDLGNIDEVSDKTVEELGIKPQEEMVSLTPEGKIKVGGNEWNMQSELPNYGIEYDKDGNVKAVSLKDDAGKTVMYEGQIAEDAAYQVLLKQTETPEQRQAINEILEKDEELNRQLREAEKTAETAAAEVTEPGAPKTKAEQYSEELDKTKESDPEAYWSVSPVSAEDAAKGTIIDTPDGAAIVKPDGDIAGLFKKATSKAKGVAQDLLKRAVAAGGKKLDNFDTYLTPQYIKAGFRVVSRVPFSLEYGVPFGYNKEKHGTPDVVAMIYDPEGKLDIEEKTFDDYDEAMAYRDSFLEIEAELEGLAKLFDESDKGFRMSQVDNAKEALKGILPGVKFIVHETKEAYNKAVGDNSSGTYIMYANGDRVIHINKQNANGRTVAHEVFHAVILDKIKGDKKVQEITARMVDAVYKTASPELRAKLDAFAARYSDKSIRDEERLAELIGIIADGYPQMSSANKSIVKRWLDALAKAFGLKPFTDNEVIDLLNTLARKVSTGEVISEEDVSILGYGSVLNSKSEGSSGDQMNAAIIDRKQIKDSLDSSFKLIEYDDTNLPDNIKMPNRSTVESVIDKSGGAAIFINSDGTKVGIRKNNTPLHGGWRYTYLVENQKDDIGFAATSSTHVKNMHGLAVKLADIRDSENEKAKGKPIAVFVTIQNAETMLGEWYAGEFFMEGIDKAINNNAFKGGINTAKKLLIDALTYKSQIENLKKKIKEKKESLLTAKDKNKINSQIDKLKNQVKNKLEVSKKADNNRFINLINSENFNTHDGRIKIAKELSSKKFSFGYRVNLLKQLIPLKSATGSNKEIKKALLDVNNGRVDFYNEHLDEVLLNKMKETNYDESSIGGVSLGGFFMDPYISFDKFYNNRKNGIKHAQFNESFTSNGDTFVLDSVINVNKLAPEMGYPTNKGYELYNSSNKTNFTKNNTTLNDRFKIANFLYKETNNNSKYLTPPFTSIGGSMYTSKVFDQKTAEDKTIIRKQIVGENANLSQNVRDNLDVARSMEDANKSARTIRIATGWERGADDKWRYEVPDNIPFFKNVFTAINKLLNTDKFSDGLSIKGNNFLPKELLNLYPDLNDINFQVIKTGNENEASYNYKTKTIEVSLGVYPTNTISSLLHEIQHVIQDKEGFTQGGNLSLSALIAITSLEKKLAKPLENATRNDIISLDLNKKEQSFRDFVLDTFYSKENGSTELLNKNAYKIYKKLSGEVESRNVEKRINMTPEQRRKTTLQKTEDVSREDQIIFFKRSQLQEPVKGSEVWKHIEDITPYEEDIPGGFKKDIINRTFKNVDDFDMKSLLKTDPDFKDYYEGGEVRYDEDEVSPRDLSNEIVVVDGILLDGYSRVSVLLRNGEKTTNAYVAEVKRSQLTDDKYVHPGFDAAIEAKGNNIRFQQAKTIDEIVRIAKEANYSDAAISSFLKAKGFSDAQIANAMSKTTITEDEAYDKFNAEFKKSKEEITNKKTVKEYIKQKYQNIIKNWSNRQVEAQSLLSKTGMVNTLNLSINSHGYSGKAKRLFEKSYDKIYKGLSTEKRDTLDKVIQAKRFIAIDNNRADRGLAPVKHPNYINKQESQMYLDKLKKEIGDKAFNDITARADEYFSTYKKLLKDVYENGLISKEAYDSMSDVDYQPRVFLQFVTDFEGDLKTAKNSVDSTSLSSDQIKSMKEGDVNSLVTNSEWLLSNSLVARTNAMAKNNINRRFMTDEFPKAKERFDKLDPKNLKGDDKRFYEYFKELQSKVIDNPIVGYTKDGNPKYKYDDLKSPINFTKAYYYVDGVQHQFFLEDGLHKSWHDNVDGFLSRDAKELISYASGSALVKAIATGNNPAFPIVNTPRDLMFTAAFSDEYSNFIPASLVQISTDVIKSIREIGKKESDLLNKYYEYGGAMDFLSSQGRLKKDSLLGSFTDKMVPANVKDKAKGFFNAVTLKKISEYSELMFRLGIFQRSINNSLKELGIRSMSEITDKQQADDIYNSAVASARGILDFNKGGVAAKDLESIIPYINVAFQGGSVALNAFKKNPVATTSRIFQIATIASTIPAGLSLFLIAASKGDDDEDKTAHEIYLDAMAGVSKYQKSKYMNIVTGAKNEDGQYRVIKIAKAQELSPIISVTDDITENMIRQVAGKELKSNETIVKNAMFSLKNNVLPFDVTSPSGTIVRNPLVKAILTYQTGYDFFRDQPLAMGLEAKPAPYEGLDMKSVEGFYKDLGPKYGLSPVRSKAFVESLITTPDTNPFVGIMYAGAEAMSSNKDAKNVGENLVKNIYKSTGKRIVSYTSDFNRNLEAKQKLEKQIDEIKLKDAILKSEIKLASDRFIAKDITKEQLMDEFKDLDPFDKKRALMKIRDKKMMKDVESNIIDIKYEKSAKVKALMIQNYYGNILDKSDDSKKVIIQMKKAGNILTPEVIYELKNAQ